MNMCIPRQSWFYTSSARPTRQSNTAASPVATMEQLLTHTCAQKIILIWDCIFRSKQELKPGEELKRGFDLSTSAFHVKTKTHTHTETHQKEVQKDDRRRRWPPPQPPLPLLTPQRSTTTTTTVTNTSKIFHIHYR